MLASVARRWRSAHPRCWYRIGPSRLHHGDLPATDSSSCLSCQTWSSCELGGHVHRACSPPPRASAAASYSLGAASSRPRTTPACSARAASPDQRVSGSSYRWPPSGRSALLLRALPAAPRSVSRHPARPCASGGERGRAAYSLGVRSCCCPRRLGFRVRARPKVLHASSRVNQRCTSSAIRTPPWSPSRCRCRRRPWISIVSSRTLDRTARWQARWKARACSAHRCRKASCDQSCWRVVKRNPLHCAGVSSAE
mmetsp:Transcript_5226/g.14096  ORF Transcript_5226/g.14096 Transcript_5226/m.14096 type:complete len:254 (-) Transcript_5226:477-1238(-)